MVYALLKRLQYDVDRTRAKRHIGRNCSDIILCLVYLILSLCNLWIGDVSLELCPDRELNIPAVQTMILIAVNIIILIRKHLSLLARQEELIEHISFEGKWYDEITIRNITGYTHIIKYGYVMDAVIIIAAVFYNDIAPLVVAIVAGSATIITVGIELLDDVADICSASPKIAMTRFMAK